MASVLSLRPQSPFKRSFSDNPYLRSCSPLRDQPLDALRDITSRNVSACSLYTLGAIGSGELLLGGENNPPPLTSRSLLDLGQGREGNGSATWCFDEAPRKRACGINRQPPTHLRTESPSELYSKKRKEAKQIVEVSSDDQRLRDSIWTDSDGHDDSELIDLYDAMHIPLPEGRFSDNTSSEPSLEVEEPPVTVQASDPPFRRWMSTLRRRHADHRKNAVLEIPHSSNESIDPDPSTLSPFVQVAESLRRNSESMSSSLGYVTAIKSASMTVASASIAPRSDAGGFQNKARTGNRSSHFSDARKSTDSAAGGLGPVIDESAWLRSIQRRKIVEEIVASEESYIGDLKVLINVSLLPHYQLGG